MNLLHIDVEGGLGRIFNKFIRNCKKIKRNKHKSYVVCRRKGPIQKKYKDENINFYLEKNLYSFVPRKNGKNIKIF